jgi:hypothetical protein
MNVIDKAKAHFSTRAVKVIEVPEWGDDNAPLLVYASPMTLAEKRKLFSGSKETDIFVLVDLLIMKAKDQKGDPIFTLEHKRDLTTGVDPDVIARVANEILQSVTIEDHLKN